MATCSRRATWTIVLHPAWAGVLCLGLLACSSSGPDLSQPEPDPPGAPPPPQPPPNDPPSTPQNLAPQFVSQPPRTADHNREYSYTVRVEDPDGDPVGLSVDAPSWLAFESATARLSGLADWDNVGTALVTITATDGSHTVRQAFTIEVRVGEIDCDTRFDDPATSLYVLPFPPGRTYTLFQGYCPPNPTWGHHNWFAYDFDLAIGDTVVAARAGEVVAVVERFVDGTRVPGEENLIYVEHDDGSIAAYVHLTRAGALVIEGDVVAQGEPIGLSGDTGNSSGPHLHFHVFHAGGFTRHYSLPISFRNAHGPLNANGGPVQGVAYTALP